MPRVRAVAVRALMFALAAAAIAWALATYAAIYVGGGSMAPALRQGDLVIVRRGAAGVHEGSVLWVAKRGWPNGVLHRVRSIGLDDTLVLKGDANPVPDLAPTPMTGVRGVVVAALPTGWVAGGVASLARMVQSRLTKP